MSIVLLFTNANKIEENGIGQTRVAVKRQLCNDKDVGSNPTDTRNEKRTLGDPPTEGSPMVQQYLSGRPANQS